MKSRWQKSLEAATAAFDTPMPWARGERRSAMILRRRDVVETGHDQADLGTQGA